MSLGIESEKIGSADERLHAGRSLSAPVRPHEENKVLPRMEGVSFRQVSKVKRYARQSAKGSLWRLSFRLLERRLLSICFQ